MQSEVRRAMAFATVASMALAAPVVGTLIAVPFALIAVLARMLPDGRVFDIFADRRDRARGELRGLIGFVLGATGLALFVSLTAMPVATFVSAMLLVSYGNLTERLLCQPGDPTIRRVTTFSIGGLCGGLIGQASVYLVNTPMIAPAVAAFLAITGTLVGVLLRVVLAARDDPVVLIVVAFVIWLFTALDIAVGPVWLLVAVLIASAFGYLSWRLDTASISGMLTGIVIGLLTIVLGGAGWFVVIIAFFAIGGAVSKYRYEDKQHRGVAEPNEGARRGRNVLGNAAVALVAVIGFAGSSQLSIDPMVFVFAFAGSIATATSDTISSEIGVLYGPPRLVTSLQYVEPGTDGGITLEGELAGIGGAVGIALLSWLLLGIGPVGTLIITLAGFVGMTVDSFLGALFEGRVLGNQTVNLFATFIGATVAIGLAVVSGTVSF